MRVTKLMFFNRNHHFLVFSMISVMLPLVASMVLFSSCAVCLAILCTNPDAVVRFPVGLKWDLQPNVGPKVVERCLLCFVLHSSKMTNSEQT